MSARNIYITKVISAFVISFAVTLALVLSALAKPLLQSQTDTDTPYRTEEFTINGAGQLKVETSGGSITVAGSETGKVRVEMYVRRNGKELLPSDTDLEDFDINISQSGNNVDAIVKHNNRRQGFWNNLWNGNGNNISISFVVYTPQEISTDLHTSGGHIEARGLEGIQQIATSGGHLELDNLQGTVDARTSGGHIAINNFEGDMQARTSGGHIEVEHSKGNLDVHTSGGHIELQDVAGTIDASTSGGHIEADIAGIEQSVNLRTSGGSISISVPDGLGLDLDLHGNNVDTKLANFSGNVERDDIQGSINGGGPKITARTSGGGVRISYR